jgi:hypothetical protein
MTLDEQDLRQGLKQIVGTWQVDFVVNAFSDDLRHIPATDFKSDDGRDFSAITYTFFEDHTMTMADAGTGKQERGSWEQTGWGEYHYTLEAFYDIPDDVFKKNAETLSLQDGALVFSLGFLAIGMKKIAEGEVTKEPDIADLPDDGGSAVVGRYAVAAALSLVGEDFGMHTREQVEADLQRRQAAGEIDGDEVRDGMQSFSVAVEFTPDHRVIQWMPLPDGVSDEEIRAAVEAGEIGEVRDGFFAVEEKEWKAAGGKYYYNTGEYRETFGEVQSPWDELIPDDDGLLPFGSGTMKLRRTE